MKALGMILNESSLIYINVHLRRPFLSKDNVPSVLKLTSPFLRSIFFQAYSMFSINIALTKSGKENVDQVLEAVFAYLKMLRGSAPSERIFNELKQIKALGEN